jgi:hypothetical protein
VFGIGRNRLHGPGHGLEENAVDHLLVLVSNAGNFFRHGEDDVEVLTVEKLGLAILDPLRAGKGLALWAMAIAAAIVKDALVLTLIALFDMAAEGRGST